MKQQPLNDYREKMATDSANSASTWKAMLSRSSHSLIRLYPKIFGSPTFRRFNYLLFQLSLRGLGVLNYESFAVSGEKWLSTKILPKSNPSVIIDAGANEGEFSALMSDAFPNAKIFAFEPHPRTMKRLVDTLRSYRNVRAFNCALGAEVGEMELHDYDSPVGSDHASLYREAITEIHGQASRCIPVQVDTLDSFAAANGIDKIDFLKIDTEGHEYAVLMGARGLLGAGRIRIIQFEFNSMHVVSRVFFRDIVKILPEHVLFRLLPRGLLPLEPYAPVTCEIFEFQNIVAVPKSELEQLTT
jgi:FkbM family methyltransferase